jgi:hypothetical protein
MSWATCFANSGGRSWLPKSRWAMTSSKPLPVKDDGARPDRGYESYRSRWMQLYPPPVEVGAHRTRVDPLHGDSLDVRD